MLRRPLLGLIAPLLAFLLALKSSPFSTLARSLLVFLKVFVDTSTIPKVKKLPFSTKVKRGARSALA